MHRFLLSSLVPTAAANDPDGIAVCTDDQAISWDELDSRVGRLAAALVDDGVERGDRVGIYLHKTIESVVAVHGVLRAGAAYVPIDPLAPVDMIESIVADCDIKALVSHDLRRSGLAKLLPKTAMRTVVGVGADALDEDAEFVGRFIPWAEVMEHEPIQPVTAVADDLAYVMYTSGSTGRPKGLMHTHRSGMAYALMAAEVYELSPADRVANFSPLHFDMSTFEIFAAVSAGSTVVLVPEPVLRMPASLTDYLSSQRITTMYTVPSLMIQMLTRGAFDERDWSTLRWVMPAGEVFPQDHLRHMMDLLPNARFSNVYGPAEVNQVTHFHAPSDFDGILPIGEASPGAEVELIDEDDEVITGAGVGHLIARTDSMMAGYWRRPDLDDEGFFHRVGPGGRLHRWYRTGDVVERESSGNLLFLGRSDNQVKVRGYRVELEVVESAVGSLSGIEQAVVGLRPGVDGDGVLVARYVPLVSGSEPLIKEWRSELSAALPSYAIPRDFEPVDGFPTTPSGKIDRRRVRHDLAAG